MVESYAESRNIEVSLSNTLGLVSYARELTKERWVGWQLQGDSLRLFVLLRDPDLQGKGDAKKGLRAAEAQENWLDWFDFSVVDGILGPLLETKGSKPGAWNHYDPDFV